MIEFLNRLIHGNCVAGMKQLPDACIPMTVTSPPYDNMRDYCGHSVFDFESVARELYRITIPGGVVAWHVREECRNGNESGTSSRQRLFFKEVGFNLLQTLAIDSTNPTCLAVNNRYGKSLDWLIVATKGKPRTFNPIRDVPAKTAGQMADYYIRDSAGKRIYQKSAITPGFRIRGPIWTYTSGSNTKDLGRADHPAMMKEALARDIIISWSRVGDLVFDPFAGVATSLKMAMLESRHYLGFEIHRPYCELGWTRLEKHRRILQLQTFSENILAP